ncbi:MAG: hypothetical protein AAFN41_09685 [Planctomycetota bacterium]
MLRFLLTVRTVEDYLEIVKALRQADVSVDWSLMPSDQAIPAVREHALAEVRAVS